MLDLLGRIGDGWVIPLNTYMSSEEIKACQWLIDTSAKKSGRPPDSISRIANIVGVIDEEGKLNKSYGNKAPFIGSSSDWKNWIVSSFRDSDIDTFVFWPSGDGQEGDQVRLFADKVVPEVRASLADRE